MGSHESLRLSTTMATSSVAPRPVPAPHQYEAQTFLNASKGVKPSMTFDISKWERLARDALAADPWGYVSGNAGIGETDARSRKAFRKWAILPSRLVQTKYPELETTVLGQKLPLPLPIALAPIGVQIIFHRDAEIASVKAAAGCGVPYTLSSATCTSIEDVAAAREGGKLWFQRYWHSNGREQRVHSVAAAES